MQSELKWFSPWVTFTEIHNIKTRRKSDDDAEQKKSFQNQWSTWFCCWFGAAAAVVVNFFVMSNTKKISSTRFACINFVKEMSDNGCA